MRGPNTVDVNAFLNDGKMGAYQWLLLALCFLTIAADGMDVAIMGFLAPAILEEWGVSRASFGMVMSAAPIGLVLGALLAGPLSDRWGRKKVLITSVLLFGLFTLLSAGATSLTELALARLLCGLGLGAAMPNASTLLSEYAPERSRSLLITVMFTGFNLGSAVVGFAAAYLLPLHGWRSVLLLGGAVPLCLVPLLILLLPESARFMLAKGQPAQRIAATLNRVCGAAFAADTSFTTSEAKVQVTTPIRTLFTSPYIRTTLSLWVTYFMGLLVIYLLTGWLPTLIKDAGLPISRAASITAMFQVGGTVGAVLVGWAMDRSHKTRVIAGAYLAGGLAVILLAWGGILSEQIGWYVAAAGFFMSGAQTGLNAYAPSCYPTLARATGVSWMLGIGRLGSISGALIGGLLLSLGWGFAGVLSLLVVPALLAAVAITQSVRRASSTEMRPISTPART